MSRKVKVQLTCDKCGKKEDVYVSVTKTLARDTILYRASAFPDFETGQPVKVALYGKPPKDWGGNSKQDLCPECKKRESL